MYSYIIGKITEKEGNKITVENGGIGYEILMSTLSINNLAPNEKEIKIYTYFQVKEDGITLFGFKDSKEKELFLKLIEVTGVGPKSALNILSNISVDDLRIALAKQDVDLLSSVKGIGKKTAERMIVELKDKIDFSKEAVSRLTEDETKKLGEAIEVLCGLGVSKSQATKIVHMVYEKNDSAEGIVTKALFEIGKVKGNTI